jgi:hypothetical protein
LYLVVENVSLGDIDHTMMRCIGIAILSLAMGACSTGRAAEAPEREVVVWHQLGAWSGHGNMQTESFLIETGALRVRWETRNEQVKDIGRLRLILQSSVSGRPLQVAAEQQGVGHGEAYVPEGSRPAYVLIESADIDWSFTVEEGIVGTVKAS